MKEEYAQQHCAHSTDACPHRVGRANGNALRRLHEQIHACHGEDEEAGYPEREG